MAEICINHKLTELFKYRNILGLHSNSSFAYVKFSILLMLIIIRIELNRDTIRFSIRIDIS